MDLQDCGMDKNVLGYVCNPSSSKERDYKIIRRGGAQSAH